MSAPNMVPVLTDMEILHAAADFSIEEPPGTLAGFEAGARYGRSFARRRALAELRALVGETCELCRENAPYVRNAAFSGIGAHPSADGHGFFVCTDSRIRNRISEIEAEAE